MVWNESRRSGHAECATHVHKARSTMRPTWQGVSWWQTRPHASTWDAKCGHSGLCLDETNIEMSCVGVFIPCMGLYLLRRMMGHGTTPRQAATLEDPDSMLGTGRQCYGMTANDLSLWSRDNHLLLLGLPTKM